MACTSSLVVRLRDSAATLRYSTAAIGLTPRAQAYSAPDISLNVLYISYVHEVYSQQPVAALTQHESQADTRSEYIQILRVCRASHKIDSPGLDSSICSAPGAVYRMGGHLVK